MPEASYFTLTINDVVVGRVNIRATHSVKTFTFDIPPNALQAGFNSIRLTAELRHRVDCSLQATYELWTQIDPTQTGLAAARVPCPSRVCPICPRCRRTPRARMPIRAIVPGQAPSWPMSSASCAQRSCCRCTAASSRPSSMSARSPMANARRQSRRSAPIADVAGLVARRAASARSPVRAFSSCPPIRRQAHDDRRHRPPPTTHVSDALRQNSVSVGSRSARPRRHFALRQAFPGYRMFEGGERVKLRDLGVASQEFSGPPVPRRLQRRPAAGFLFGRLRQGDRRSRRRLCAGPRRPKRISSSASTVAMLSA